MNELENIKQATEDAVYLWRMYAIASTPENQATTFVRLNDAMSDLATWLDGYDYETGTLPWEREDEEN